MSAPTVERAPAMPRPYRGRMDAAVARNTTCVSCHAQEAEEWRRSKHRNAYVDTAFQDALRVEPMAFCRGCHAPESDSSSAPPPAVADLGVGCVTCHVAEEGVILAGAPAAGASSLRTTHPVVRSPAFARAGGCGACHEFRFPEASANDDADLMQETLREHQSSAGSDAACPSCHMPVQSGRRSHAFAESRDPAWLRARLGATAARADGDRLRVTLVQAEPAHAFPTGDLFRRLEVGSELRDEQGRVVSRDVRYLARRFALVPGQQGRRLLSDDRVFDDPKVVDLVIDPANAPRGAVVSWWVTYQRVATVGVGIDPSDARVESEVRLHEGAVRWDR